MGYYNIFIILKNFLYNFRRIFKYISISLLALCFIAICLLLMSTKGECATQVLDTFTYNNTTYNLALDSSLVNVIKTIPEYQSGDYWFFAFINTVQFFPKTTDFHLTMGDMGIINTYFDFVYNNSSGACYYNITSSSYGSKYTGVFERTSSYRRWYTRSGNDLYFWTNSTMYYGNNVFYSYVPPYNEPVFVNAEDSNWDDTLVNGEFNYFFIDCNDATLVSFEVRDLTLIEQNYNIDIDSWSQTFYLWELPDYIYNTQLRQYAIPKMDLRNGYFNNHTYQFVLAWQRDNDTYSKDWTITTDFSQAAITNNEEQQKNKMEQDISSINNFLNDDNYNSSSIANQMPSTDVQDPTEFQVNNIFNMIRNAFSTTNAQDVVISLPHTDEKISIPANLVTSKIPNAIVVLIQGFYWFLICRFIIKDISKTVEHAKSGEILDAKDGNIKTDLL